MKVLLELAYWFENRTASALITLTFIEKYFLSTPAFNSQLFAISNPQFFLNWE